MNYLTLKHLMAVLILSCCSLVLVAQPKVQRITVNVQNASLEDLFDVIEKQSLYRFSYRDILIDGKKSITINKSNSPVEDILDVVLSPNKLQYHVVSDRSIVISELQAKVKVAKNVKISGIVTDENGAVLIGVNIFSDLNNQNGTVSDIKGLFALTVPNGSNLIVSYIGYKQQVVVVDGAGNISIKLAEDTNILSEVVVVGYGEMRKSDLTGSTVSVKSEDVKATGAQSLAQALQGKAAGVQISTTSAAPGGASMIRIRGTNSLMADANPLYVVDGFPVDVDDVNSLNLNDVASVEILKDASSTAIYGSRGANGVILIQTSTGTISAPKFNFSSNFGYQEVYRTIDLMNGTEFAGAFNEYLGNKKVPESPYYDGSHRDRPLPEDVGEGTDWFDQIMQPGFIQSYNLSVAGGTKAMKYRVSGGYYMNEGVVLGGAFDRINLNINNTITLNRWLSLQSYISLSRTDTDGSGDRTGLETSSGTLNNAMKMSPVINVYDVYGDYNANSFPGAQSQENPVAFANEVLDNIVSDNIMANMNFIFKPLEGLEIQAKFGANIKNHVGKAYLSSNTIEGAKVDGRASISAMKSQNVINEYIANYKKVLGKHRLFVTGAFSLEHNAYESNSITGTGLVVDDLSYAGIASAEVIFQPTIVKNESSLVSALARINYNYDDRFLVTFTNRVDGNSGFSIGNKWGNFPSAAIAWRISQENFLENIYVIDDMKIRASWGVTGNSKIGNSRSLSLLSAERYPFGDDVVSGMGPSGIANPNLKWETTEMYNVGVDLSMFQHRLVFTAEAYYKYTSDMLMSYDIPSTSGYQKAFINAGELENKGLEFAITGRPIDTKFFKWTLGANISFNRDKVTKLYNGQDLIIDIGDKQSLTIREGYPIRQFQGAEVSHIDPNNGEIVFVDKNGDGNITALDNVIYGSAFPDFTYGINSKLQYKSLMFDIFVTGSEGNWVQNRTLAYLSNTKDIRNNMSAELVDRWQKPGDITDIPKFGSSESLPSFEDASYIRIQNISLSYSFSRNMIKSIDKLTLSASIENLYVWTDYTGWDPDVNSSYGGSSNVNVGQDVNSYPKPRIYRVGLNFNF